MIAEASPLVLPSDLDAIATIREGKRPDGDVYPTPQDVALAVIKAGLYTPCWSPRRILDPGAGNGVWGASAAAYFRSVIWGVEQRPLIPSGEFDHWHTANFLVWETDVRFDLVVGNPPYSLAEPFVRRSRELLAPGGQIVFLLQLSFLGGQKRAKGLWTEFPPERVLVLPKRPSFSANGKTDRIEYAAFYWREGFRGTPTLGWLPANA